MDHVPLRRRWYDLIFVAFFVVNLCLITYIVDLEQLVIANPAHFAYPAWPPAPLVDLIHWWGHRYDPLLMARPPFWRMTIWIDVLYFGPFYLAAIVAFLRGGGWIRVPALVWSGLMIANVLIPPDGGAVRAVGHTALRRGTGGERAVAAAAVRGDLATAPRPSVLPPGGGTPPGETRSTTG